ncbi:MAG: hypothetical protein NT062_36670, partial [Proteobacteria bacterium]|nr:hypothetical protein [Pseudomonadota bacterium]
QVTLCRRSDSRPATIEATDAAAGQVIEIAPVERDAKEPHPNDFDLVLSCGNPLQTCGGTFQSNTVESEFEAVSRICNIDKSCSIKIRIKNGAALAACGATTTERVGVAWSYGS